MSAWHFSARAVLIAGAVAAAVAAAPAPAAFAEFDAKAELDKGVAATRKGNIGAAVSHLTLVIKSTKRSVDDLARAFLYRAKAYQAMQRPAQALSDIQAALWLRRLKGREKAELLRLKREAIAAAGLPGKSTVERKSLPPVKRAAAPRKRKARTKARPPRTAARAPGRRLAPWERSSPEGPAPLPATTRWSKPTVAPAKRTAATSAGPSAVRPKISARPAPMVRPKPPARSVTIVRAPPAPKPRTTTAWPRPRVSKQPRATRRTPSPPKVVTAAPPRWPAATAHRSRQKARSPRATRPVTIRPFATTATRSPQKPVPTRTASIAPPAHRPAPAAARPPAPKPRLQPAVSVSAPATAPRPARTAAAPPQPSPPTAPRSNERETGGVFESFMVLSGMKKPQSPLDDWRAEADRRMRERQERIRRHNASIPAPEPADAPPAPVR